MAQAFTRRTVANLVVVLRVDDEAVERQVSDRPSDRVPSMVGVASRVHEGLSQRGAEIGRTVEVLVVSERLTRHERVQRVVEVIVPLRVEPVASFVPPADETRIVAVALGDHPQVTVGLERELGNATRDRFENVRR
jgi:hypothetical protein